jgi:hypothetical protein
MTIPDFPDIPELAGWVSLPAVGDMLHVSRQRIYQMGLNERKFASIHKIAGKGSEVPGERKRPAIYVVSTKEAEEFLAAQRAAGIARHDEAGNPLDADGRVVDPDSGKAPEKGKHHSLALTPAGLAAAG